METSRGWQAETLSSIPVTSLLGKLKSEAGSQWQNPGGGAPHKQKSEGLKTAGRLKKWGWGKGSISLAKIRSPLPTRAGPIRLGGHEQWEGAPNPGPQGAAVHMGEAAALCRPRRTVSHARAHTHRQAHTCARVYIVPSLWARRSAVGAGSSGWEGALGAGGRVGGRGGVGQDAGWPALLRGARQPPGAPG